MTILLPFNHFIWERSIYRSMHESVRAFVCLLDLKLSSLNRLSVFVHRVLCLCILLMDLLYRIHRNWAKCRIKWYIAICHQSPTSRPDSYANQLLRIILRSSKYFIVCSFPFCRYSSFFLRILCRRCCGIAVRCYGRTEFRSFATPLHSLLSIRFALFLCHQIYIIKVDSIKIPHTHSHRPPSINHKTSGHKIFWTSFHYHLAIYVSIVWLLLWYGSLAHTNTNTHSE